MSVFLKKAGDSQRCEVTAEKSHLSDNKEEIDSPLAGGFRSFRQIHLWIMNQLQVGVFVVSFSFSFLTVFDPHTQIELFSILRCDVFVPPSNRPAPIQASNSEAR